MAKTKVDVNEMLFKQLGMIKDEDGKIEQAEKTAPAKKAASKAKAEPKTKPAPEPEPEPEPVPEAIAEEPAEIEEVEAEQKQEEKPQAKTAKQKNRDHRKIENRVDEDDELQRMSLVIPQSMLDRLDEELRLRKREAKSKKGMSMSWLVRTMLEDELTRCEKKRAKQ